MEQLKDVSERHRFDPERLAGYLAANLPGFGGPLEVRQFRGGQSNPTYLLTTPGRHYVLRSKPGPRDKLLPSAHAIEREYRVMTALAPLGIPVPAMRLLCEDETVIGRAFYVMERVDGRIFWEPALPELLPAERTAVYDEMNRVLAALHRVDADQAGLGDYGKAGNYFERQIGRWTKQYQASETEKVAAMDNLIAWLPQHVPPQAGTAIVHGDYRIDNLVFHPTQPRAIAVLDWELSTLGDPLADFSYHCMSWHLPASHGFRGVGGLDLAGLAIPAEADYVARYCERTGRGPIAPAPWTFYLAYNLFRIAAILQGVYKRSLDGLASSDDAAAHGHHARELAELGWRSAAAAAG